MKKEKSINFIIAKTLCEIGYNCDKDKLCPYKGKDECHNINFTDKDIVIASVKELIKIRGKI